jgi:hypothetical protein
MTRGGPEFHGYPKIRMVRASNGLSTEAVCVVRCARCRWAIERRASAIKRSERTGGSFLCGGNFCLRGSK